MLGDPIGSPFDAAFAPWPLRFYILHQGVIQYKAQVRRSCMVLHPPCIAPSLPCPAFLRAAAFPACLPAPAAGSLPLTAHRSAPPIACLPSSFSPLVAPQPSDCSYDLSELRSRLLELLAEGGAEGAAAQQLTTGE